MGINDAIRDGYNWILGGTLYAGYGQEGFIMRGRLVDMSADRPYAAAALARLDELAADGFDYATERKPVMDTFMAGLRTHLGTMNPAERFGEFRNAMDRLTNGEATPMLNAFAEAPQNVRDALMNAVTYNPRFLDHVSQSTTGPLATLLTPEVLKNATYSGPIADILNTIASDPNYDFARLDAVGNAAKTYFDAAKQNSGKTPEEIDRARRELLGAVRGAGGNLPAMANFDMGMLMQFLKDLFTGDMNMAINNLASGLGLQGQQLQDFQSLMQPLAGIMKFMGQDYYEYAAHYGPQFMETGTRAVNLFDGMMNGQRVPPTVTQTVTTTPGVVPNQYQQVSERTTSLSGEALTTQVASLDQSFNPNARAERQDGYKPDIAPSTEVAATTRYNVGGLHATA